METPATQTEAPPHRTFTDALYRIQSAADRGDGTSRAKLARLKRSLTRDKASYAALREIGDLLPERLPDCHLDAYLVVAALFAHHPAPGGQGSLGKALKALRQRLSVGKESLDRRFAQLIESDTQDLPYRLRQVTQQLAAQNVPVRYDQLLKDLLAWSAPKRHVQRQWARDYWT